MARGSCTDRDEPAKYSTRANSRHRPRAAALFLFSATLLTSVGFGLAPALQASSVKVNDTLKEGGRSQTEGVGRNRLRSLLVVSEFALALVLLIGAGLMIRTFSALQAVDAGFNPHNVISMVVSVAGTREAEPAPPCHLLPPTARARSLACPGCRLRADQSLAPGWRHVGLALRH